MTGKAMEEGQWSVERVVAGMPFKPKAGTESPVPFFHVLELLKTTPREGWRRKGIPNAETIPRGESISDHMYRMSIITMFAPVSISSKLNIPNCMKMALIHDMAESLVGDITPVDNVPKPEKSRRESTTMDYLTGGLLGKVNGGLTGEEIKAVWQEYEDGKTLDSKFVHDVDKLELILQMFEYEQRGQGEVKLSEFAQVRTKVVMPEVQAWCDEVLSARDAFWEGFGGTPPVEEDEKVKEQHEGYYGKDADNKS